MSLFVAAIMAYKEQLTIFQIPSRILVYMVLVSFWYNFYVHPMYYIVESMREAQFKRNGLEEQKEM